MPDLSNVVGLTSNAGSSSNGSSDGSSSKHVCDYQTYMQLLQENAELHRANRLLQAVTAKTGARKSKDHNDPVKSEELLRTELKISEARIKDLEAMLNGQSVDLTLVEEKRHLQHLNVGLSEKVNVQKRFFRF